MMPTRRHEDRPRLGLLRVPPEGGRDGGAGPAGGAAPRRQAPAAPGAAGGYRREHRTGWRGWGIPSPSGLRLPWRAGAVFLLLISCGLPVASRTLQPGDMEKISSMRADFATIMLDLNQSLRAQGISEADRDCIDTIRQDLLHIAQELSGYEKLMTIEGELNEFSDDQAVDSIVRFGIGRALEVLYAERKRLVQPPDQCSRLPLSLRKGQTVLQSIDATVMTLEGIKSRLPRTDARP